MTINIHRAAKQSIDGSICGGGQLGTMNITSSAETKRPKQRQRGLGIEGSAEEQRRTERIRSFVGGERPTRWPKRHRMGMDADRETGNTRVTTSADRDWPKRWLKTTKPRG